ncbi:MAG: phosphoribosylformylglycinamidine synthase [Lachnospiraceae bacterium]|nr:phosphoribosylformylglycinamidine synthase [Lachnospiraceae bacterium]
MSVKRIYVEKKPAYAVAARGLKEEIESFLGIRTVTKVRVLIRYDMENLSEATYEAARGLVFSEPPVDDLYEGTFPRAEGAHVFSVEYLPGQFDQRADSAEQCVKLLKEDEEPVIRSATTYVIEGEISDEEMAAIQSLCINPVDSRLADGDIPDTLIEKFEEPADVKIFDGFRTMEETPLRELYESLNLAMTFADFRFIQEYFAGEEPRDPTMPEIRVLDTYWSDHCRHTTFQTELKDISFTDGDYREEMEETYQEYLADRADVYGDRKDKYICLMDLALIAMKKLKKDGLLTDQEETDEINACSIVVPVTVDGETEEWLINFKNETHNHPTEIEPFGGAATCLGGAIRDPLSGRTYVYQAMRVTGAADPTAPVEKTLVGKLPQKKIVTDAAHGYSSYGNQIGLATGYVKEIYHPGYVAKRMEVGAVMGAAPRKNVIRETSDPGDIILLIGGRTGRDGCGGATGSSKAHNSSSLATCGAEVQKGNAPTERKIQRLFRRPEVSRLIRKCNDFGAGGVSVAIGELADGLWIDLNMVPKKYAGLDGTEIAISESQERMAVVIDPENLTEMMGYIREENLEAVVVAEVKEEKRLVMYWRDKVIVDISRDFLNTNGAHQETDLRVQVPNGEGTPLAKESVAPGEVQGKWMNTLRDLNVCSQKGLVEMFDSTVGAGSVLMPYGGKYQLTETQSMAAKLPVLEGKTDAVTMMSYGFDPYLSSWSPYHGAQYAVISSVAKIVAGGGDSRSIHFTFQEFFRKLGTDPERWGEPFAALLGAFRAQKGFGLASIGGKDSMSGSFNEIDVPPTLISFAVDMAKENDILTPELKQAGDQLVLFSIQRDAKGLPDYAQIRALYEAIHEDMQAGRITAAYEVERMGLAEAVAKMAFGNKLGVAIDPNFPAGEFFAAGWGNIVAEVPTEDVEHLKAAGCVIGEVTAEPRLTYGEAVIDLEEAIRTWSAPLEKVFPTHVTETKTPVESPLYDTKDITICNHKLAQPRVFIPAFPGTNCEVDSAQAMERAGARAVVKVMRNLTAEDIRFSVDEFAKEIAQAQIIFFPGGFSAGDEPDGSAKFFAATFRNAKIREEVEKLLNERDGLALGICNGFQALIKLGLVPEGKIVPQGTSSPTLTFNTIGRHISRMNYVKVVTNKSPWLQLADLGGVYCNPASHGEGRFVANDAWLEKLFANGQVATQYCDPEGNVSMDETWNSNGSFRAIEGITSPDGRVLGKMLHNERRGASLQKNIYGDQDMRIFEAGVRYFR